MTTRPGFSSLSIVITAAVVLPLFLIACEPACPTPEELTYLNGIVDELEYIDADLSLIISLFSNLLLEDEGDNPFVDRALTRYRRSTEGLLAALSPPGGGDAERTRRLAVIQAQFEGGARETLTAVDLWESAFERRDRETMEQASKHISRGTDYFTAAAGSITNFCTP